MAIQRTKYMNQDEIKQFRMIVEGLALKDMRVGRKLGVVRWMLVDLALQTGLRVSEIARLDCKDINLNVGFLSVQRAKKKKQTIDQLPINGTLRIHLKEFLDWKRSADQGTGPDDPLFVGKRGRLTRRGLQQLFKNAVKVSGLPGYHSIHGSRHTLAVQLLKKSGNLRLVQKQLGHSSPTITANMYADISFEDCQSALEGLYDPK